MISARVGRSEEVADMILKSGMAAAGAGRLIELGACVGGIMADDADMASSCAKRSTAHSRARPARRGTGPA